MAHEKFTKADDITVPQSVGPKTAGNIQLDETFQVFQPHQGRDLIYLNPKFNSGSTEIQEELDNRIPLGTYTLNNRDYWENNNFNESTFQSYLKDNLETHDTLIEETPDGPIVRSDDDNIYYNEWLGYSWSIDALPFVVNPNNDEIIHLDRYYDKNIEGTVSDLETTNKEAYELATEGKINYYLSPRIHGRLGISGSGNIDIFTNRPLRTAGTTHKNYFEWNITGENSEALENLSDNTDGSGMYLFKLNWGDGSELEYTDKPQLLEPTTLFEHFYEKPGFYSITGVVYHIGASGLKLRTWEKFQTNILLNPSLNYELNLLDYNNFASIGGISKDSAFVKSLYNIVGINPLIQDNARASEEVIEKLNEFDKILLLNVLGKVDSEVIQPYENLIEPYSRKITDDSLAPYEESNLIIINACADPNATNYWVDINGSVPEGSVLVDNGSCLYTHTIGDWDFNLTATVDYGFIDLTWDNLTTDDINLFTTAFSEGWEIDWSTVVYRIQSEYYEENTGLTGWLTMDTISYDTNTYNFNPDSPDYVADREYNFRIQIQVPDPDTNNIMESNWTELESIRTLTNEIGGLVNIIMSSTRDDNIDPAEGTTHILSTGIDDTYPNSLTILADSEYGFEFQGWTIQPPNDDTNVVYIENPNALATTIHWSNGENLLSQDIINVTVHAGYEEVQTDTGNPVNVGIYGAPNEYGNVSYPADFTLTSDNQTEDISAYPEDDDDEFTYSFDKWEVQSGEDYVGFGPNYQSETSVRNATLKWNNAGNPNDQNASVKAFFSREQNTGGNGTGTCFLEGTMITMVDGTTKPIEQIQVGDEVMSYDDDTNLITHNKVFKTMFHPPEPEHISYGVYLIINNNIKVTTNHAILADTNNRLSYNWPIADALQVGDYLFDKDLNKIEITSIERVEEVVDTYNFEVENSHTYIAENVIVHNIGGDGPGGTGKGGTGADTGGTG